MVVVNLALVGFVLVNEWVHGDFARTFPDCDPCGFVGYAGRAAIVSVVFLGPIGAIGAVAGWLIEKRPSRIRRIV